MPWKSPGPAPMIFEFDLVHDLAILASWKSTSTRPKPTSLACWNASPWARRSSSPRPERLLRSSGRKKNNNKKRGGGSAKGEFTVPDDFNDPLPKKIEDLFYK